MVEVVKMVNLEPRDHLVPLETLEQLDHLVLLLYEPPLLLIISLLLYCSRYYPQGFSTPKVLPLT